MQPSIRLRLPFYSQRPISQRWGANPANYAAYGLKGHEGVDWPMPVGTPILCCAAGVVKAIDTVAGDPKADPYGVHVRVQHDGYVTVYAHLSKVTVKQGQAVRQGDVLGLSGNTGNSTGPHLHLSFRLDNANRKDGYVGYSDPLPYMDMTPIAAPVDKSDLSGLIADLQSVLDRLRMMA